MRSATSVELSYALLRAIEVMVRDPSTRDYWRRDSGFLEIIQFYVAHQQPEFGDSFIKLFVEKYFNVMWEVLCFICCVNFSDLE